MLNRAVPPKRGIRGMNYGERSRETSKADKPVIPYRNMGRT